MAVTCAAPAAGDTAAVQLPASALRGCTADESDTCDLTVSSAPEDPLVALQGSYALAGCLAGRPYYARAPAAGQPALYLALLVRAGGAWCFTPSLPGGGGAASARPLALLLPNPAVWTPTSLAASRPQAVTVSYASYAHDAWFWSGWPTAGAAVNTSVAALARTVALPSPSHTVVCAASAFDRSPPPAPPAPAPRGTGATAALSRPDNLGGLICGLVAACVLTCVAAAALLQHRRRASDADAPQPWWGALQAHSDEVHLGPLLGAGGFAEVYAATWRHSPVAAKVLHPRAAPGGVTNATNAALAREVLLMSRIRHPNVLSVYGVCLKPAMIILELGTRGSLAALLRSDAAPKLGWRERCRLAHGVACGLAFLHAPEPPIVHLDVKCANVVLEEGLTPKVSDFGLSALLQTMAATPTPTSTSDGSANEASGTGYRLRARGVGTPLYSAPELGTLGDAAIELPLAVDSYSFGAGVLHELAHEGMEAVVGSFVTPLYAFYAQRRSAATQGGTADASMLSLSFAGARVPASGHMDSRGWGPIQTLVARELAGWQPELAPRCPAPLADAIRRCCQVDPAARPRMDTLRDELLQLMDEADTW